MPHCPGCGGKTGTSPVDRIGHILGCGWHGPPDPGPHGPRFPDAGYRSPYSDAYRGQILDDAAKALKTQFGCDVSGSDLGGVLRSALDSWVTGDATNRRPSTRFGSSATEAIAVIVGIVGFVLGLLARLDVPKVWP